MTVCEIKFPFQLKYKKSLEFCSSIHQEYSKGCCCSEIARCSLLYDYYYLTAKQLHV